MDVSELRRILEGVEDDVEVRLAHQPHWPFEYSISTAAVTDPRENLGVEWYGDTEHEEDRAWHIVDNSEDPGDDEHWVEGPYETQAEAELNLERKFEEHIPVLYLAEGLQLGYLPGEARKAIGW